MLFLEISQECIDLKPVLSFMNSILSIIQWGVPILLIIMGSIDLGKAVLASDDKEIKGATSKLIKRAIAAIAIFFIPMLVKLLVNMVGRSSTNQGGFIECWQQVNEDTPDTGTNG